MQSIMLESDIRIALEKFISWKKDFGYISYDRMDFWSSRFGVFAKKIFYKNKVLGAPFAIYGLLLENFLPTIQKCYSKKHREIIGDSHFALGYLELYKKTYDQNYLEEAERLLADMLKYGVEDSGKLAWGYNFGWQTEHGYWNKGIPLITITPYAFWAFKSHYEITGSVESKAHAIAIANWALEDLQEKEMRNHTKCFSYSPVQKDIVINANSYRAAVLCHAYELTHEKKFLLAAKENIRFIIEYQGDQGEWYYEAKGEKNNFIDHFHTCFVLRNLKYCYDVIQDKSIKSAIELGYEFYKKELFYSNGYPKHFAKAKYAKLRKYEMYDFAESIKLGILLSDIIPGSSGISRFLAQELCANFQLPTGHFVTRVTSLNTVHKVPYLRWPQAQLFYSLTMLYSNK